MNYVWAFILVLIVGLGLFSYSESVRIDTLKESNQHLKDAVEISETARKKEQQDTIDANNRRTEYVTSLETKLAENDKLAHNLNTNVQRVFIRAKCPATGAEANTSGSTETGAELSAGARQALLDFRRHLIENESRCEFFRQEAIAR